ncbi:N-acetylmuramoyl-L-alanine amidase [Lachnospiraceae bacterium XBB1006]|nr:N-acetylmuramoyl-L-alanine amidase [Lachnospiraceae bacterium XBB1006]
MNKPIKILLTLACAISLVGATGKAMAKENAIHITYVDCNQFEGGEKYSNYFVVGWNESMKDAADFSLIYRKGNKENVTRIYEKKERQGVFYVKEGAGQYQLCAICFRKGGRTHRIDLQEEAKKERNIDLSFLVEQPEEVRQEASAKVQQLSTFMLPGKSGNSQRSFSARLQANEIRRVVETGKPVVVIDPGHGGGDAGCNRTYDGVKYKESELCLQIAKSCQQFLEKGGTASVFLTRSTDVYVDFNQRTQLAFTKGAAILVSFHLNSTGTAQTSATGAEAIYQNGNYNSTVAGYSKQLAQKMVEQLSQLGLKNRGIYYKNSAATKYPDGTVADNFAINRQSKVLGIPGIIVEHCFLNNPSDFRLFLEDSRKTDQLAKADADGIAAYLRLGNTSEETPEPQTPQAVTGVKTSGMTNLRVKVAFSYSGGIAPSGYELFRANQRDGSYTKVASGSAKAKYMVDASGIPGQTYYYKVRAYVSGNGVVYGAFSDVVSYAVLEIPQWTESAEKEGNSRTISWKRVAGADSYEVKRSEAATGPFTSVGTVTKTSFTDTVMTGKRYFYEVRACRNLGGQMAYSKYSSVRMMAEESLRAKREEDHKIVLRWAKENAVAGYLLYRSIEGDDFSLVKEFTGDTLSYTDEVDVEKAYQYRLCAFVLANGAKVESFGEVKLVKAGVKAPVIKETTTQANGKVTIHWEKSSQATGYELYRLTNEKEALAAKNKIATLTYDKTSYCDAKAKNGQAYVYALRSVKKDGNTKIYSESVSKVLSGTHIRTILPYSESKIRIAWKKMTGITGYKIYVSEKKSGGYHLVKTCGSDTTSYIHSGRLLKKTYYYRVQTVKDQLQSKMVTPGKGATVEAPEMKKLTSNKAKVVTISWKPISKAKGYRVYRSTKESTGYQRIATTTKASYQDPDSAKRTYYYKVRAYFLEEGFYGYTGYSVAVTNAKNVIAKPAKPTLFETTDKQQGILAWKKVAGVTGYKIYRSTTGQENDYALLKTVKGEETCSYTDLTVNDFQVYYYRIRAYVKKNKTVYSDYSNAVIQATVYGECIQKQTGEVSLNWKAVNGAACYVLSKETPGEKKVEILGSFVDTTYVDTDVKEGERYVYRIAVGDGSMETTPKEIGQVEILGSVTALKAEAEDDFSKVRLTYQAAKYATGYEVMRRAEGETEYTLLTVLGKNELSYVDSNVKKEKMYQYRIRPLQMKQNVVQYGSYSDTQIVLCALTPIMGVQQATKEQMVAYFSRVKKPFPQIYADPQYGGVDSIEAFVQIIIEEASAEGVRADLVAAQIYKETGYLQFGGDVKVTQCNFAGLGAVGNGVAGAAFPDVRTGIRAQVQHLKAYGDEQAVLTYECVDSRFAYVQKGSAKYIEWLGIKENPEGKGWATATNYGYDLVSMMKVMKSL